MNKGNYKAILFHPEGDFVTDFSDQPTKQDVWDCVGNMGSRWIFYPIVFVTTDTTVVDTPEGLEFLKGKRIKTVQKYLSKEYKGNEERICNGLNDGAPLGILYRNWI